MYVMYIAYYCDVRICVWLLNALASCSYLDDLAWLQVRLDDFTE